MSFFSDKAPKSLKIVKATAWVCRVFLRFRFAYPENRIPLANREIAVGRLS